MTRWVVGSNFMADTTKAKSQEIIIRDGKPVAVILDIFGSNAVMIVEENM